MDMKQWELRGGEGQDDLAAWEANWGAVPVTDHELGQLAADMKQILDPDLVFFVEVDGKTIGMSLTLP